MTIKDRLSKLYNEKYEESKQKKLVKLYSKGGVELLSKHLHNLDIFSYSSLYENNKSLYQSISNSIFEYIEDKLKNKDIINVGFVIHSASMWSCEELYRLFENDSHFNTSVIVSRCNSDANLTSFPLYNKTLRYFESGNYNIRTLNLKDNRSNIWKKMGKPNILFYLSPYNLFTPKEVNLKYIPADVLTIYIPYCFMMNGNYGLIHCPGIMYSWRHFVESKFYVDIFNKEFPHRKNNIIFLGYPKMDYFYKSDYNDSIWKNQDESKKKKRIIYAPHHTINSFSTFKYNYEYMLNLAQNYSDETTWIVKPHPLLGKQAINAGLFKDNDEYENYLNKWRNLDNADVVEEGTYEDIFITSDAMICDSISFLAEYQFTHKPLLFLQNQENPNFDEFGLKVYEQLYKTPGRNHEEIEKFIEDVVINENDPMKEQRMAFFNDFLDKKSPDSSSYLIYKYIKDYFNK